MLHTKPRNRNNSLFPCTPTVLSGIKTIFLEIVRCKNGEGHAKEKWRSREGFYSITYFLQLFCKQKHCFITILLNSLLLNSSLQDMPNQNSDMPILRVWNKRGTEFWEFENIWEGDEWCCEFNWSLFIRTSFEARINLY